MKLRLILAGTLALVVTAPLASAQEQPWLADRRYGEGIGIRAGNFELHPGIAAEFGYDTNYFQRADDEPTLANEPALPVEDAFRLRITPSFTLSTLSGRRLGSTAGSAAPAFTMRAKLYAAYNELFGSDEISDQRHLDVGVGLHADIAPQGRFGADISGDFVRSGEPSNLADTTVAFDRGTVRGGAGVTWRPGGGLFSWRVGYGIAYNYFEDVEFETLDNVQHSINTRGRWKFLPRSALLYDAQYGIIRYQNAGAEQPNGDFVEARVGFSGLVTKQLAFLALIGWNSSYYEAQGAVPAQNYDGIVAHGELKYFLLPPADADSATVGLSSIAAGYLRSFSNSYLGAFYVRDRGYLNATYFLGGVFLASLEGGLSSVGYPASSAAQDEFSQRRIDARLFAEYRLSDIFGVNTTMLYDQAFGGEDYVVSAGNAGPDGIAGNADDVDADIDDLTYKRFQVYLGVRAFW